MLFEIKLSTFTCEIVSIFWIDVFIVCTVRNRTYTNEKMLHEKNEMPNKTFKGGMKKFYGSINNKTRFSVPHSVPLPKPYPVLVSTIIQ